MSKICVPAVPTRVLALSMPYPGIIVSNTVSSYQKGVDTQDLTIGISSDIIIKMEKISEKKLIAIFVQREA